VGAYQFEVELLPRYSGAYHLNPAKVELMYFPVLHAHEAVKKVIIK
jgi:alpha-2-macroglobulin